MAISQKRSRRKTSGSRYKPAEKKNLNCKGSPATLTKLGSQKKQTVRERSGDAKTRLLHADIANVFDPKQKKYFKLKITTVTEVPANRNFVRRNIMTCGSIVQTEMGKAKITSRPGQEGTINAVLI